MFGQKHFKIILNEYVFFILFLLDIASFYNKKQKNILTVLLDEMTAI